MVVFAELVSVQVIFTFLEQISANIAVPIYYAKLAVSGIFVRGHVGQDMGKQVSHPQHGHGWFGEVVCTDTTGVQIRDE